MNLRILLFTGIALLAFGSGAFAAPMYADTAYDYTPGAGVAPVRMHTGNALGAPDDQGAGTPVKFLSLGIGSNTAGLATDPGYGGSVSFSFANTFTGWATVYETTYSRKGYREYASLLGSLDGQTWTHLGDVDNQNVDPDGGSTVSFSGVYRFLKVVDATALNSGTLGDGFDVDAVKVNATPIPGAIWLLGSGLVGLVGLRKRFTA